MSIERKLGPCKIENLLFGDPLSSYSIYGLLRPSLQGFADVGFETNHSLYHVPTLTGKSTPESNLHVTIYDAYNSNSYIWPARPCMRPLSHPLTPHLFSS